MPFRHKPEDLTWLIHTVRDLLADGDTTAIGACELIHEDWQKRTGRACVVKTLAKLYCDYQQKIPAAETKTPEPEEHKPAVAEFRPRTLPPGFVVVAIPKDGGHPLEYATLKEAVEAVNGNAHDFTYYEARKLRPSYRSILTFEEETI